jgi:hypothetical protein
MRMSVNYMNSVKILDSYLNVIYLIIPVAGKAVLIP